MSQTRIRYVKTNKDGILKSFRNVYSEKYKAYYTIQLNTNNMTYEITNTNSRRKYSGGENINNLHVLKRKVKDNLSKLGVAFDKEVRDNSSRIKGENCGFNGEKKCEN